MYIIRQNAHFYWSIVDGCGGKDVYFMCIPVTSVSRYCQQIEADAKFAHSSSVPSCCGPTASKLEGWYYYKMSLELELEGVRNIFFFTKSTIIQHLPTYKGAYTPEYAQIEHTRSL